jgi:hypothetical protein
MDKMEKALCDEIYPLAEIPLARFFLVGRIVVALNFALDGNLRWHCK